jgi:hypothetical protein
MSSLEFLFLFGYDIQIRSATIDVANNKMFVFAIFSNLAEYSL